MKLRKFKSDTQVVVHAQPKQAHAWVSNDPIILLLKLRENLQYVNLLGYTDQFLKRQYAFKIIHLSMQSD